MSTPGVSRFHAIVSATPLHGSGLPVVTGQYRLSGYEPWGGVRFQDPAAKRRREQSEAGPSAPKKVARRTSDDDGTCNRAEPTIMYRTCERMMKALQDRFKQGPDVDFHGQCEMVDGANTHKARIQTVANEIWKTTGYRFTVKDHPQFTNGHKTRFWCSQDEAHRSKSSRAARKAQGDLYRPRTTSTGEVMAKNRFPCRSRLLISSRDSTPGTQIITVRMHHHVAHEPYVDINLPPEVAQGVWENYGWLGTASASSSNAGDGNMNPPPPIHAVQEEEEEEEDSQEGDAPPEQDAYDMEEDIQHEVQQEIPQDISPPSHPPPPMTLHNHEPRPTSVPPPSQTPMQPTPPPPPPPPPHHIPNTDIYRRQMQAHIHNLREFCDGLEYQLQFNDYRMLDVLEREGGSFLNLVADCLNKEGRLVTSDQPVVIVPSNAVHPNAQEMINQSTSGGAPMTGMDMQQGYEGNPGINPQALGC